MTSNPHCEAVSFHTDDAGRYWIVTQYPDGHRTLALWAVLY
ncbi:hypothetical protein [Acidipropionibacterium jensenii]|nr:hypothetical protein [Acidipropionibacterium jensenii]